LAFGFLALYRLYTILFENIIEKTGRISRVAITYLCITCHGLRLRRGFNYLAILIIEMLLSVLPNTLALSSLIISELNPFNQLAYGPLSNCLRLKVAVTCYPPRLATSEWLTLARRESHPLYVTTLPGRSDRGFSICKRLEFLNQISSFKLLLQGPQEKFHTLSLALLSASIARSITTPILISEVSITKS